ncbi:MAG: metallophosphoesterase [Bacteroidales bacterium]|jgi:hypothetical protein
MEINIIHLTDIHGADLQIHKIGKELSLADVIVVSGDITHFGREKEAGQIITNICHYNNKVLAVPGNCDYSEVDVFLSERKINLNRKQVEFGGLVFCGLGGSLPCPGYTPCEFTDNEADKWLTGMKITRFSEKPVIFVSHQPPFNTTNDRLTKGDHVGSRSVRKFIELSTPVLCLTGHIHEGTGIDSIGNCKIVNPGPLLSGNYASIHIKPDRSAKINLKKI